MHTIIDALYSLRAYWILTAEINSKINWIHTFQINMCEGMLSQNYLAHMQFLRDLPRIRINQSSHLDLSKSVYS